MYNKKAIVKLKPTYNTTDGMDRKRFTARVTRDKEKSFRYIVFY